MRKLFLCLFLFVVGISQAQNITIISPNGGEVWQVGTSHTVSWSSSGTSGFVNLEYSTDNGANWNPIIYNTPDIGFYSWNISGSPSTQALFRVIDFQLPTIADQSDAVFTLSPGTPVLTLYSPNGGEQFVIGGYNTVSWTATNITTISLEYSSNNGTTWNMIDSNVNAASGNYQWITPGPQSFNCFFRIRDVSDTTVQDVSFSSFQIRSPYITYTTPVLYSVYAPGDNILIQWNSLIQSDYIDLEYRTAPANPWIQIDTSIFNQEYYNWIAPALNSTQMQLRISDHTNASIAQSSPYFTITPPQPSAHLISPASGQQWAIGSSYNITWNSTAIANLDIELSVDSMQTWQSLASNVTASASSFNWTVSGSPSNDCFIRLLNSQTGTPLDTNTNAFEIYVPSPVIYLSSPFGAELWPVGSTQFIQWSAQFVNQLKIELSTDNGNSYTVLVPSIAASAGFYSWTVAGTVSNQCFIKISDATNPAAFVVNTIPFSIINNFITVTTPNGGESISAGYDYPVYWSSAITSPYVDLDYSIDNGATWTPIVSNFFNSNYYLWNVPNTPSNQCKIKVSQYQNPGMTDQSDAVFTITPPVPSVTLLTPSGGEVIPAGTFYQITWSSVNTSAVDLLYSVDSGSTWLPVANGLNASTGLYNWLVPPQASTQAYVKIQVAGQPAYSDTSAADFTIIIPPTGIQLIAPFNGQTIGALFNFNIQWTSQLVNQVNIDFSFDNGISWTNIVTAYPALSGTYQWQVPQMLISTGLIRITDASNPSVSVVNLLPFSIEMPQVTLQYPNGGEVFSMLSPINIQWNSSLLNGPVDILVSVNNGLNWQAVQNQVSNTGFYVWYANAAYSSNCRIKVRSSDFQFIEDMSNATFSITPGTQQIIVTSPASNSVIGAGSPCQINWMSSMINNVRIQYTSDNGLTWQNIATIVPASANSFLWTVPTSLSGTISIRVANAANMTINDVKTDIQVQTPGINVLYPNGGETLNIINPLTITWSSLGSSGYVNISVSADGNPFIPLVNNWPDLGSWVWNQPFVLSNQVKIKISDAANTANSDSSDQVFTLTGTGTVQILDPTAGMVIPNNQNFTIHYTQTGVNNLVLEFSQDGGNNWSVVSPAPSNLASVYNWAPPQISSVNCKLRLSDAQNSAVTFTTPVFTLSNPFIQLVYPNGGEVLSSGIPALIQWNSTGLDFVNIYYSSNSGSNWSLIDSGYFNTNAYLWSPVQSSTTARIKVVHANDASVVSISNQDFTINSPAPSVTLVSPNGGEQIPASSVYVIKWNTVNISQVKIEYSSNGGSSWNLLSAAHPAYPQQYYWNVPVQQGSTYKVRVSNAANTSLNDVSAANFSVVTPQAVLQVTSPNGGQVFQAGSFQTLTWNQSNIPFIRLYFSSDNGAVWNLITLLTGAQQYYWQVPNTPSNQCKIKVEHGNLSFIYDESDAVFTIDPSSASTQTLEVDTISDLEICAGASFQLNYSASGSFSAGNQFSAQLSDSSGNFNNPVLLGSLSSALSGVISCQMPANLPASDNYKVRVVADQPAILSLPAVYNISVLHTTAVISTNSLLQTIPGSPVQFSLNAAQNAIQSVNWNFGDGASGSGLTLSHFYALPGYYSVTATYTDTSSCTFSLTENDLINSEYLFTSSPIGLHPTADFTALEQTANSVLFVANSGITYLSSDSGHVFTPLWYSSDSMATASSAAFDAQQNIYIGSSNGKYYTSGNNGLSWVPYSLNSALTINSIEASFSNQFMVGSDGLIFSKTSNGWNSVSNPATADLNAVTTLQGLTLAAGNNGNLLKWDGQTWLQLNSGTTDNFTSIAIRDSLRFVLASSNGSAYLSNNAGTSLQMILSGTGAHFTSVALSGDSVWLAGKNGIIYFSDNMGANWTRYSVGTLNDINQISCMKNIGFIAGNNGMARKFGNPLFQFNDTTSGIYTITRNNELIAFPNPASSELNILAPGLQNLNVPADVYNINGLEVLKLNIQFKEGLATVNLSDLNQGVYIIKLQSQTLHTLRVIKL